MGISPLKVPNHPITPHHKMNYWSIQVVGVYTCNCRDMGLGSIPLFCTQHRKPIASLSFVEKQVIFAVPVAPPIT